MTFIDSTNFPAGGDSGQWLDAMLATWKTPAVPASLDRRVFESYGQRFSPGLSLPNGAPARSVTIFEVPHMKTCELCNEEFSDQFAFCPLDGAPLVPFAISTELDFIITEVTSDAGFASPGGGTYHLTLLDDAGLVKRLTSELRATANEAQLTWPELRRDPFDFARRSLWAGGGVIRRGLGNPNVAFALVTAFAVVIGLVAGLFLFGRRADQAALLAQKQDLVLQEMVNIPDTPPAPENGVTGLNRGKGQGSAEKKADAGGGGGGGLHEQLPASNGKLPLAVDQPPIKSPELRPPPPTSDPLVVPPTLDADPALTPPDTSSRNFGDPKSSSNQTSQGTGTGGGIGDGNGSGVGPGNGSGYGPGNGRNMGGGDPSTGYGGKGGGVDYGRTFKVSEVNQKARVISKPQPEYTEDARKLQIIGTVRLSVVFSASGQVTNIQAISQLPYGLTERAINAAKRIQFTPAIKDGRPVSSYMVIEYNFNIY